MSNVADKKTGMPRPGQKFTDTEGLIQTAWYRFLLDLWRKTGASNSNPAQSIYLQYTPSGQVGYYSTDTGQLIGITPLPNQPGLPAQTQAPLASPWIFTATETGNLIVDSGLVEFSRGSLWITVSQAGGTVPMLLNDRVRITWFKVVPTVIFYPST